MSQAEMLLSSSSDTTITHSHTMKDSNSYFVIDPSTRTISNGIDENFIMQYDHDSEIYTFEVPRYIDGHDMLLCNRVYVHWNNVDKVTNEIIGESSEVTDLRLNETDTSTVICSWTISRNSTQRVGILSFLIQYKCVEDGVTTYEWHSDIYSNVQIKEGRNNGESSIIEYSDILEQWRERLFGAGDTVEASIQAKSEEEQENITSKGATVLATIPEDYTTTYNMANNAVRTRANAIVETVGGSAIVATDCSDDYLRNLRLFGKSTQAQTTGVQLLDFDPYVSGLTATSAYCHVAVNTNPFTSAGTYYYSCSGTFGTSYKLWAYDSSDNLLINTDTGVIDVSDEQAANITKVSIVIQGVASGATYTGYIYPMINIGTTALPWEPYSGSTIAPNPDWPQKITAITNPTISLAGANMLKNNSQTVTKYGVSVTAPGDGTLVFSGTATDYFGVNLNAEIYLPDGIYFLSGAANGLLLTIWGQTSSGWKSIAVDNGNGVVFEANSDRYPYYLAQYSVEKDRSYNVIVHPMINVGTSALSWETYKEPVTGPSSNLSLHGIPVDSGGNYIDVDGQQWVCDEVDFGRGVLIQRIAVRQLLASDAWATTAAAEGRFWLIEDAFYNVSTNVFSTHFVPAESWDSHVKTNNTAIIYRDPSWNDGRLSFKVDSSMSLDDWKTFLDTNVVLVVYELATPIETALTDTNLLFFSQLHSNYPTTTILNNRGMYMEISYNADTKTYLEQLPKISDEQAQTAVDIWLSEHFIAAEGVSY